MTDKSLHRPDYFLLAIVFVLTIAGLLILTSASSDLGKTNFNDSYYFLKHQLANGFVFGVVGFITVAFINYRIYKKFAILLFLFNLVLLGLVFSHFGVIAGGASRWLSFGGFSFQPAEFLKITFVLYLAAWLTNPRFNRAQNFLQGVLPFFIICGVVAALLIPQPATSTVVILLASGTLMLFASGARWLHIFGIFLIGALILTSIVLLSPYRLKRITTFLHPSQDTQGSGYQINQALITIGSGGVWGIGYGKSTTKVNGLPAPIGDSIFAIAAQEMGFMGAGTLVILFATLVARLFWLSKKVSEKFGSLVLIGFASIIGFQSIVNMGAISGLLPLTGVPLPFISFGGTALGVFLVMSGISLNISRYS